MSPFVILRHETVEKDPRPSHWDLMFQKNDVLATWATPEFPSPGVCSVAERLASHRLAYLDYEGPVSRSRGQVRRAAWGQYVEDRWEENRCAVWLQGQMADGAPLQWRIELQLLDEPAQKWRLSCRDA